MPRRPLNDDAVTSAHLDFLSRSALEFIGFPADQDIYRHIARQLRDLAGNAIVVVSSYNSATRESCSQAIVGAGKWLDAATEMIGLDLRGYRRTANDESHAQISTGRLVHLENGLYGVFYREVPRAVCAAVEKMIGIRSIYGVSCVSKGVCYGTALMILRARGRIPPAPVVEAFMNQAAVALQKRRAEDALRASEERYRALLELAADAWLVVAPDGRIAEVNACACRALGRDRAELVGCAIGEVLDGTGGGRGAAWHPPRPGTVRVATCRARGADGRPAVFEAHVAPLPGGQALVTARDVTERRRTDKAIVETSLHERQALGRALHDSVGQELAGLAFLTRTLEKRLRERGAPEADDATQIARLAAGTVAQTRAIAQGLCPATIECGNLADGLERLARRTAEAYNVRCELAAEVSGAGPRDVAASQLYLIAQEAIMNAVRHGRAGRIDLTLTALDGRGRLVVRDDGRGFAADASGTGGMGLRIMRYRAEMIDGALDVRSGTGGTTVACDFPLPHASAAPIVPAVGDAGMGVYRPGP